METIKNIAAIIGLILSVTSVITLCTKWGRGLICKIIKLNTKDLQDTNERQNKNIEDIKDSLTSLASRMDKLYDELVIVQNVSAQQCRDTIKNIYYKYHVSKKIPLYERKTADKTYELYCNEFKKNGYAKLLYSEICKWEIDTISFPILEED